MVKVKTTLICDDIRFERGNKLSLMGVYNEHIFVANFPFLFSKLGFFQTLTGVKDSEKFNLMLRGESISKISINGEIKQDRDKNPDSNDANIAIIFNSIAIQKPGRLIFETTLSSKEVFKFEIAIAKASAEHLK